MGDFSGYNCDFYAKFFCKNGYPDYEGHSDMFGVLNNWPELNCCACGGGIRNDPATDKKHKYEFIDKNIDSVNFANRQVMTSLDPNTGLGPAQNLAFNGVDNTGPVTIPYSVTMRENAANHIFSDDTAAGDYELVDGEYIQKPYEDINILEGKYFYSKKAIDACNSNTNCNGIIYIAHPITGVGDNADLINTRRIHPDYSYLKANIHGYDDYYRSAGFNNQSYKEDNDIFNDYIFSSPDGHIADVGPRTFTTMSNSDLITKGDIADATAATTSDGQLVDPISNYQITDKSRIDFRGMFRLLGNDLNHPIYNANLIHPGTRRSSLTSETKTVILKKHPLDFQQNSGESEYDLEIYKELDSYNGTPITNCSELCEALPDYTTKPGMESVESTKRDQCCLLNVCNNHITDSDCKNNDNDCLKMDGHNLTKNTAGTDTQIKCGTNYGVNPNLSCDPELGDSDGGCNTKTCCYKTQCKAPNDVTDDTAWTGRPYGFKQGTGNAGAEEKQQVWYTDTNKNTTRNIPVEFWKYINAGCEYSSKCSKERERRENFRVMTGWNLNDLLNEYTGEEDSLSVYSPSRSGSPRGTTYSGRGPGAAGNTQRTRDGRNQSYNVNSKLRVGGWGDTWAMPQQYAFHECGDGGEDAWGVWG